MAGSAGSPPGRLTVYVCEKGCGYVSAPKAEDEIHHHNTCGGSLAPVEYRKERDWLEGEVDRERAAREKAEAERDSLIEALKPFAKAADEIRNRTAGEAHYRFEGPIMEASYALAALEAALLERGGE